jgi:hypothetical protein
LPGKHCKTKQTFLSVLQKHNYVRHVCLPPLQFKSPVSHTLCVMIHIFKWNIEQHLLSLGSTYLKNS